MANNGSCPQGATVEGKRAGERQTINVVTTFLVAGCKSRGGGRYLRSRARSEGRQKRSAETHKSPAQKGKKKKEETACYSDSRTKEGEGRKLGRDSPLSTLVRGEAPRTSVRTATPPHCPSNLVRTRPSPLFLPLLINRRQGGASRSGKPPPSLAVRLRETGKSPEGERRGRAGAHEGKSKGPWGMWAGDARGDRQ